MHRLPQKRPAGKSYSLKKNNIPHGEYTNTGASASLRKHWKVLHLPWSGILKTVLAQLLGGLVKKTKLDGRSRKRQNSCCFPSQENPGRSWNQYKHWKIFQESNCLANNGVVICGTAGDPIWARDWQSKWDVTLFWVLNPNPSPYLPDYAVLGLNPNDDLIASLRQWGKPQAIKQACGADKFFPRQSALKFKRKQRQLDQRSLSQSPFAANVKNCFDWGQNSQNKKP